jgi:hypothetical protein
MSSNNIGFSNSSNNINQINQNNNSVNNSLGIINIIPQRRIPGMGINPLISNNSVSNRLFNSQINNINQRYSNNNNLLLRYFNSNNSNINLNNNQEENNIEQNNEVSPMEVDNQIIYTKYEIEEEEIKEKIESLINILQIPFTKPEYEIDFQLVYSKCYEICLHWKANELYQEVEKLITKVVATILEEISKLDDEEPNYSFMNNFNTKFEFFLKKILQTSDALSYMDNIYKKNMAATGGEENLLQEDSSILEKKNLLKMNFQKIMSKNFWVNFKI